MIPSAIALSLALAGGLATPCEAAWPDDPPARVLLLGNSFSRGLAAMLRSLFASDGLRVEVRSRVRPSYTLARHLEHTGTARTLENGLWDIVVLQEQSDGIDATRYPAARALDTLVGDAGAATMFFMTWRDSGAPPSAYDTLHGVPGGSVGYVPIAFELDAPLAPIGWAFRAAVAEDPGVGLWARDGHHSSREGRYLAACVLYATMLRRSPVGLEWQPPGLSNERALALQTLAETTVFADLAAWNIPPA